MAHKLHGITYINYKVKHGTFQYKDSRDNMKMKKLWVKSTETVWKMSASLLVDLNAAAN
jgi:hypothetical protein